MITLPQFADKTFAVLGLGKSGLASAHALMASGATVWAWDDNPATRERAKTAGLMLVDLATSDWQDIDSLVLSPGIPHRFPVPHPVAELARAHGCEIIGDIELLGRAQGQARFVGISGTNGKSTTTSLIGHVLSETGYKVQVGGNIGNPVLDLEPLGQDGIYILELSSYQLELTPSLVLDIAILLNISPDHLDRHGGLEGYVAAKRRIFQGQRAPQTAILGCDDDTTTLIAETLKRDGQQIVIKVSGEHAVPSGVFCRDHRLIDDLQSQADAVLDLTEAMSLPGAHNAQNSAATYAACRTLGLPKSEIGPALISFPGLAHRQERIGTVDGVLYVNDSKATNAEAAARALSCYEIIYWVLGGRAKDGGLKGVETYYPRVAHAFLIGEAAESFAAALQGSVPYSLCGTLDDALQSAREKAEADGRDGVVVLLSPAAASFDQYPNFEVRGDAFRQIVASFAAARTQNNGQREYMQ